MLYQLKIIHFFLIFNKVIQILIGSVFLLTNDLELIHTDQIVQIRCGSEFIRHIVIIVHSHTTNVFKIMLTTIECVIFDYLDIGGCFELFNLMALKSKS